MFHRTVVAALLLLITTRASSATPVEEWKGNREILKSFFIVRNFVNQRADEVLTALRALKGHDAELTTLAEGCAANRYVQVGSGNGCYQNDCPVDLCEALVKRTEVMARATNAAVLSQFQADVGQLSSQLENAGAPPRLFLASLNQLGSGEPKARAELAKAKPLLAELGVADTTALELLSAIEQTYRALVEKARAGAAPARAAKTDAALEKLVAAYAKKDLIAEKLTGLSVVTAMMAEDAWNVELNALGVPTYRSKDVQVVVKASDGTCGLFTAQVSSDAVGGKFGPPHANAQDLFRTPATLVPCAAR